MGAFKDAQPDVGFCFSSVVNDYGDREEITETKEGVFDFSHIALSRFKGFMTSTLVVRLRILEEVGGFDESLPSHQEPELIIRITRKYPLGISIKEPLVRMSMIPHERIGGDLNRRIRGKEILLEKHESLYARYPTILAYHYFQLGLWCRDSGQTRKAKEYFWKAFRLSWSPRYALHWLLSVHKQFFACQYGRGLHDSLTHS